MSTNSLIRNSQNVDPYQAIDAQIQTVAGLQPTVAANSLTGAIAHLVTIYGAVKPILMFLATMPWFHGSWRGVLTAFIAALDGVAALGGSVDADFKAGKDL